MGTYGYAAPEYLATGINILQNQKLLLSHCRLDNQIYRSLSLGHLTTWSDVYSFGVVLLEILSGRRAIDKNRPAREHNLVEWAKPYLANKRKIFRIMDSRLEGQYSLDGAYKACTLALRCLSIQPKLRPNMDDVVKELEQLQDSTYPTSNRNPTNNRRARRHSADDAHNPKSAQAYPRPSISALHT